SDAVTTAIDAQRTLSAEDFSAVGGLPVRMGLHAGEASERNGDYFGPAVNRVARLMSMGHGGQILLSGVTRDLAHSDLPTGVSLLDLGSHRLKDLTEPEQVWQLAIAGLPAEFPPLKSLDTIPNNLPIQPTSFRGREHDLKEVKSLLRQHKLLTLFGSGGVGKTRLALQVGADILEHYPDGVWLVDFAAITDPELVSSVIAKELGMTQAEGRRVDESISQWLKRKKLLLILDNCEHVLEVVAGLADAITRSCPDVRMLATSRQALGVSGEQVLRLPSLDVPHRLADLTPAAAIQFGAVALFVDRASLVDSSFTLTDDNAPIVADICRRLDGIPLAIELAAARVKVLSIPNLAQRLNDRFKILTGGSRSGLPRQKTLTALIDWSYDLLSPQEQTLFNRFGIFAGGFSLDAATVVCAGEGIDEIDILDLLSSLTDKSLVVADTGGEQERYRLLESTRAYALEKLAIAGERDRLARRHGEYFRDEAQTADKRYGTGSTAAWLARVELELDNYRATLEWALTDGHDVALGGAVAGALERLWFAGGLTVEGRYWIGRAQTGLDESAQPQVSARLWRALALLSSGKRKTDCAERALALYQSVGDGHGAAWALLDLGYGLYQMGRLEESSETFVRALAALRECGNKWGVARCLSLDADIHRSRGDAVAGRELSAQALEAFKALGDEAGTASVLANLAELEFADGQVEQALRLGGESLEIDARGKNATNLAINYTNRAAYCIALGDVDGAREAAREGLRWARQAQNVLVIAIALQHFALLGAPRGQVHSAAQLVGYVNAQYKELGLERESTERWANEKLMAALREQLSEAEIEKLAAEGAAWSEDQAVEEALKI
ncbi:MAG: NB-ARC domain-containing protein, partial [Candidatus Eremiobacteraeota bacterium]|nr:NB-ARC domain-containing protein [Candidatus Eremiobacteraeota bacterium]